MTVNKTQLLIFAFFITISSIAQVEMGLNIGLKSLSPGFMTNSDVSFLSPSMTAEADPVFQCEISTKIFTSNSRWYFEALVGYRLIKYLDELEVVTVDNPEGGFFIDHHYIYQYVGLKFGVGHRILFTRNERFSLDLPAGFQAQLPANCYVSQTIQDEKIVTPLLTGENYEYGINYGLYIRPKILYRFGRKRSSPIRIGMFVDIDMLYIKKSLTNPHFNYGGGLCLQYIIH